MLGLEQPAIRSLENTRPCLGGKDLLLKLIEGQLAVVLVVLGHISRPEDVLRLRRAIAELPLPQHAPLAHVARGKGGIHIGREVEVVGGRNVETVGPGSPNPGKEPAGLALVAYGNLQIGGPKYRDVPYLQPRVAGLGKAFPLGDFDVPRRQRPSVVAGGATRELGVLNLKLAVAAAEGFRATPVAPVIQHETGLGELGVSAFKIHLRFRTPHQKTGLF